LRVVFFKPRRRQSAPSYDYLTSINSEGWDATYNGTPPTFDPAGSPVSFVVSRQGFDASGNATTYSDSIILTQRVRLTYPDQATLDDDRVALSDYIYSTDTVNGVTNSSAEASPKPIANWVLPDRQLVGNSIDLEIVAFHRNARNGEPVASVEFRATDGTTTVTQKVSTSQVSGRTGDQCAVVVYKCSLDISTLANPATITVNAKVYPWIGDASSVLDSADSSVAREFSPRTYRRDTTLLAAPRVAYVRTTGNDGTGVVSTTDATASANPFLTVLAAINAHHTAGGLDGAIIYIGNDGGTPFVMAATASTRTQSHTALTITRESGVDRANARVSFGLATFRTRFGSSGGWLRFHDVGIVRTGNLVISGEVASQLHIQFDQVDFDNASNSGSIMSNSHCSWYSATITNHGSSLLTSSATGDHRCFRGLVVDMNNTTLEQWLAVGCEITQPGQVLVGTKSGSGVILAFNKWLDPQGVGLFAIAQSADANGVAIVQNLVEFMQTGSAGINLVSNDSRTGNTSHVIIWHNTYTGFHLYGRCNHFYDEGSTARTNKLHSCIGNVYAQINTKGDVFRGEVEAGGDASTRVGNWAYLYGAGCRYEFSQFIDANSGGIGDSFAQAYPGIGANIGTSNSTRNDPLFTDYQGTTSGPTLGAGGGDYTLQSGSQCKATVLTPVLKYDLAGNARSLSAASQGAYE
jgi:hypothetical protein